jgi:hypothetical protein
MKLKWVDRILLALYVLLAVALLAAGGCALFWPGADEAIDRLGIWIGQNSLIAYAALAVAALVFLLWSIRLLTLAFKRESTQNKSSVSIQHTEDGAVRVSVAAMDTLVKQAIGHADGVVDIKTRIVNHEDSITVKIDMTLEADAHIPNVTMRMQRSIKNFIEEFSGIAVREVEILVSSVKPVERPVSSMALPVTQQALKETPEKPEQTELETVEPDSSETEVQSQNETPQADGENGQQADQHEDGAEEAPGEEAEHN